jgi:hypothetical protein
VSARTWRFRPRAAPDAATYVQEGVWRVGSTRTRRFLVHASADTVRAQPTPNSQSKDQPVESKIIRRTRESPGLGNIASFQPHDTRHVRSDASPPRTA